MTTPTNDAPPSPNLPLAPTPLPPLELAPPALPGEGGGEPPRGEVVRQAQGPNEPLEMRDPQPPPLPPAKPAGVPKKVEQQVPALSVPKPLWPAPEEVKGRSWLAVMALLAMVGLFAVVMQSYYAGAHGGVDQAGYLMTARLLTGEMNPGNPRSVHVPPAATMPAAETAATAPASTQVAKVPPPAVWMGGEAGYTTEHPKPPAIIVDPRFDWLRNRLGFVPDSPFQFASRMCVMTEPYGPAVPDKPAVAPAGRKPGVEALPAKPAEYRIYAKYPFGYPLLAAIGRNLVAPHDKREVLIRPATSVVSSPVTTQAAATAPAPAHPTEKYTRQPGVGAGIDGMYVINPLCTVIACYFAYFMFRQAVSPFVSLIGVLWMMCNPLVLIYSNDANSHASTLMCVTVGFWGLISFLRVGSLWRAVIGGFALGYACTIRYSEFLLVLPVGFAALVHFRWNWRRALGSAVLVASWAFPVGILALISLVTYGGLSKTGYTYCNEDTGFGWKYLSGIYEDKQVTGNWETLVTQLNRTGLFLMWPFALAGLFGLLGAAWRLGGILFLWVVPSLVLYMAYYWAPGGETTTGYLRFIVTIMPGMIFAGLWILEWGLSRIRAEGATGKWAGLTAGTALAVALLLVAAFYADGGPKVLDGGVGKTLWGMTTQMPGALWNLVKEGWPGRLFVLGIVAAIAGMWLFDRTLVAGRVGLALGAGAITALGCAINLFTIVPQVENNFARWVTLRQIVDNMRETVPAGNVVFCEDNLLNQLDCVGGWKLYNSALFTPATYQQNKTRVDQRNSPERMEDPDPIQNDRSRFYMELLTMPSAANPALSLGPRNNADLQGLMRALIDRNVNEGRRIIFLQLADAGDMGGGWGGGGRGVTVPNLEGYQQRVLKKWTVSPPPSGAPGVAGAVFAGGGPVGRGRGGRAFGANAPAPQPVANAVPRAGATYVLYELVKKPVPAKAAAATQAK